MSRDVRPLPSVAWWCAATIFVSAFLLFQVQPLISKAILPWFGGSPAVWSTCVLFFQVALLGGYGYAHWMISQRGVWKYYLHGALLLTAICLLPITPGPKWQPVDGSLPTLRILALLAAHVGLPYFLLASTGPLVQAWFAALFPDRTPYRLYALSNVGSLLALLSYPFVFEPNFAVRAQGFGWSSGFVLFALLGGALAFYVRRTAAPDASTIETTGELHETAAHHPALLTMGFWIGLAALGTVSLLAVTNHLCLDVAVVPFFWVIPLSLYLLSFIICFESDWWYKPLWVSGAVIALTLLIFACERATEVDQVLQYFKLTGTHLDGDGPFFKTLERAIRIFDRSFDLGGWRESVFVHSTVYLSWFFALCLLCHGEVFRLRPAKRHLTKYYLMISAGGALGGMFVTLICPRIFTYYTERPLSLLLGVCAALAVVARYALGQTPREQTDRYRTIRMAAAGVFSLLVLMFVTAAMREAPEPFLLARMRNFYGVVSVYHSPGDDPSEDATTLYHGRIMHGFQFTQESRQDELTSYYVPESGVGLAVEHYPRDPRHQFRLAVIGLGAGSLAAYGKPGDAVRFYEIDPQVIELSEKYFTFRKRSKAEVEVVEGDARVSMEREEPQDYDVIVLDAFSGDAIPLHLLTKEALQVYIKHLKPEGIIAIHISNRYLDLKPVVGGLAELSGFTSVLIEHNNSNINTNDASSDWILLTKNRAFLQDRKITAADSAADGMPKQFVLWTDQRSDLFGIMKVSTPEE